MCTMLGSVSPISFPFSVQLHGTQVVRADSFTHQVPSPAQVSVVNSRGGSEAWLGWWQACLASTEARIPSSALQTGCGGAHLRS